MAPPTSGQAAPLAAPPTGQTWRSYYYAGSTRIAMRVQVLGSPDMVYYLHGDHLGSTSLTTCGVATSEGGCGGLPLGDVVAQQRYLPYGAERWHSGTLPTDYRFTSQRSEEATLGSLYDYGARFYSPALGRFLSPDPIVPNVTDPQLFGRYTYARNSPLMYNDPDGHCGPLCIAVGLAVAIGAIATLQHMSTDCHSTFGHCLLTGLGAGQANMVGIISGQPEPDVIYGGYMKDQAKVEGLGGFEIVLPAAILRQTYPSWQRWPNLGDFPEKGLILAGGSYEGHSWGIGQIRPDEARAAGGAGKEDLFDPKASIHYMAYKLGAANAEINRHSNVSPLDRFMLLSIAQNSGVGAVNGYFNAGNWKGYLTADPGAANQLWAMLARYEWLVHNAGWSLPEGVSLDEYRKTLLEPPGGQP
jgi:RHS repeat-associated protein